jgi:hypothetical protein
VTTEAITRAVGTLGRDDLARMRGAIRDMERAHRFADVTALTADALPPDALPRGRAAPWTRCPVDALPPSNPAPRNPARTGGRAFPRRQARPPR